VRRAWTGPRRWGKCGARRPAALRWIKTAAAFGIATVTPGLSRDLVPAFRSGAILMPVVCGVIGLRARMPSWRDVRDAEMRMMPGHERKHVTRGPQSRGVAAAAGEVLQARPVRRAGRVALSAFAPGAGDGSGGSVRA